MASEESSPPPPPAGALPASGGVCTMDQHCINGGKCEPANDVIDHRHCVCKDGFSGSRCSRYCPLECQNSGYCTIKPKGGALGDREQTPTYHISDYMCKCPAKFSGDLCEIPYTNCGDQTRCYHGGECLGTLTTTTTTNEQDDLSVVNEPCRCLPGYTGVSCEIVIPDYEEEVGKFQVTTPAGKWNLSSVILFVSFSIISLGYFFWRRRRRNTMNFNEYPAGDDEQEESSNFRDDTERYNYDDCSQQRSVRKWTPREDDSSHKVFELHLI